MGKIKIKRKSTTLDMTAMCDVAFLLLTFFMLTTKFRPPEPLQVDIPSSIVSQAVPSKDLAVIEIGNDNRIFLDIDQQAINGEAVRPKALELMGEKYKVNFTNDEKAIFNGIGPFGSPMSNIKDLLSKPTEERDAYAAKLPGIVVDTSADWARCELFDWIITLRRINPNLKVAIKGDVNAKYPIVKNVIDILQKQNVNQFSIVTNLEANPLAKK
jgi:biopolymer transport protein ExbD